MTTRRLYRCRHDRWLAGVAGGMAEYFEIDPTVVRILWILSAFFGGVTILLYILLAFVMPPEPLPMTGTPGYAGMPGYPGTPGAAGATAPGATAPGTTAGSTGPQGAPASEADATGAATAGGSGAAGGIPGWVPPQGSDANAGWQDQTWTGHRHESSSSPGSGRTGFALGVLLVVFGAIALLGSVIPAWTAVGLGPAFILALGVALIVAAIRRPASEA